MTPRAPAVGLAALLHLLLLSDLATALPRTVFQQQIEERVLQILKTQAWFS